MAISMLHQVRDQVGHVGMGFVAGFACGGDPWFQYAGPAVAYFYGWMREWNQWGELNSPSLKDSAIDSAFVGVGGVVGMLARLAVKAFI